MILDAIKKIFSSHRLFYIFSLILVLGCLLNISGAIVPVSPANALTVAQLKKKCQDTKPSGQDADYVCNNYMVQKCLDQGVKYSAYIGDVTIELTDYTGKVGLPLKAYHFACNTSGTWYSTKISIKSDPEGLISMVPNGNDYIYAGGKNTDDSDRWSWQTGSRVTNVIRVDVDKLNKLRGDKETYKYSFVLYSSGHPTATGANGYRDHKVTYTFKFPPKGTFSGSLSVGKPAGTTKISGRSYLGTYGVSKYTATATGTVTRTDNKTSISSLKGKAYFQKCTSTDTSTCSKIDDTTFSEGLAINGTMTGTHSATTGAISAGSSGTVCRRLRYIKAAYKNGSTQTDDGYAGTSVICFTVYRPARATFSGTVATPSSNDDTNIKKTSGANMLGDGSTTSYKIKTTYTLKRTNDNPTSAQTKYTTSNSSQPDTAGTLSNALKKDKTQSPTAKSTKTASQAVGTKDDHCFYMTYEKTIDYYNAGSTRLDDVYTLDKVSSCTTIYNPKYAGFSSSIDVAANGMTGNISDGFRGDGFTKDYTVTVFYKIRRANNDNNLLPEKAASRFAVNTAASDTYNSSKIPSSVPGSGDGKGGTTSGLAKGETYVYPVQFNLSINPGTTATKCSYIKFDSKAGYIGDDVLSSPFETRSQSSNYLCVNFTNPQGQTATFSASISSTNGNYLSGTEDTNTTSGAEYKERIGNGLYGQYSITPTYRITRTNNSPTTGISSRYAISDSGQPSESTATTGVLKKDESETINGPTKVVQVDIGGSTEQCFYIGYDALVKTTNSSDEIRNFDGLKISCYNFTNPPQNYTAHYSGFSTGSIDEHTWLNRSDNNTTAVLDNTVFVSDTGTEDDGTYVDHFPTKEDGTADDQYTISFTHTIRRTDADQSSTADTVYYVDSTAYNWEVQDCEDIACDAGIYNSYSASKDTDPSRAVSGIKTTISAGGTNTINTQAKFTFNAGNKGKYLYYCQRIAYSTSADYTSATDYNNRNGHSDSLNENSITTPSYSTPICVSIRNPEHHEAETIQHTHYIDVAGITDTNNITVSGANLISNGKYEATAVAPSFLFHHTVTRYDDTTWRETNFDESDIPPADANDPEAGNTFFQSSIYGDPNYSVHTNTTDLRMYGSETLPGTRDTIKLINPLKLQDGQLVEIDGRELILNATDKNHGDSWTSTDDDGSTRIAFNGNDRSILNQTNPKEKDIADHSVMAGETKNFTMSSYNAGAAWYVRYAEITQQEAYPGSWNAGATGYQTYSHTEKIDRTPQPTTPAIRDSRESSSPIVYSIYRPFNYIINNIDSTNIDNVAIAGETYSVDYTISVSRENDTHDYITDPNQTDDSRYVYVMGYIVNSNVTPAELQPIVPAHVGPAYSGNAENDLCGPLNGRSFVHNCQILTDGQPTKLSKKENQTADPGDSFRHVYSLENYELSYTTGTITIPDTLSVGEKYCVSIAVRNYGSASGNYYISTSTCRNVSKRPALQVWGGSIISNGGIVTATTAKNDLVFGSWADYMIIANGTVKHMASGASLINGAPIATSDCITNPSPLTISNVYCNRSIDNYLGRVATDARLDIIEHFQEYLSGNTASINEIPEICSESGCWRKPNDKKTYIVRTENDITISQNIINEYATSQVVIMAKNINIDQSVTRLDAFLIATGADSHGGTIDTCANYGSNELNSDVCNQKLTVNGSLIGGNILFKRTYGADPASTIKEPAELINLPASMYIWGYGQSLSQHDPQVVYSKKLPSRY